MLKKLLSVFKPAPHVAPIPEAEARRRYPWVRWQILESTFIGYATYYLVRNNLPVVSKEMAEAIGYSKSQVGDILAATAVAYGLGKFLMGAVSDRSNPRYIMAAGLVATALCNVLFGASSSYTAHLLLWTLNGFIQGVGWGPCGRSLGHWFSVRERGTVFGIWNISHNVGGGIVGVIAAESAVRWGWRSAFYVPAIIAIVCAFYLVLRLRDTPQSMGLPPVEEYKHDYPPEEKRHSEMELGTRELFMKYIFANGALWIIALANFFVYIVRYSMLDWGPTYLREMKGATLSQVGLSTLIINFAGIGSTLLMGWVSDRTGGRRGMVSLLCMIPISAAFAGIIWNPPGMLWLDFTLLGVIGFFIYPPVTLLGVAGLDFTSKKAVGTAAGFIGLFGYLGRMAQGKGLGWLAENYNWDVALYSILVSSLLGIVLLAFTWNLRPRG